MGPCCEGEFRSWARRNEPGERIAEQGERDAGRNAPDVPDRGGYCKDWALVEQHHRTDLHLIRVAIVLRWIPTAPNWD